MARRRRHSQKVQGDKHPKNRKIPPSSLPDMSDDDEMDFPAAPPPGPASGRVLLRSQTMVSNSSAAKKNRRLDQRYIHPQINGLRNCKQAKDTAWGAGWERLGLGLSPKSYHKSFNKLHSVCQSMVDRSFSTIVELEDGMFWSTLLQGFSVLPFLMLIATICSNMAMGILFTAVGDVPHVEGWADWARLGFSTVGTMTALRNLLISMYELLLDSTAQYPLLNPRLLSRLRNIVAVRPRGLQRLIAAMHLISCVTLYGLTILGIQQGNLPAVWLSRCHFFAGNTVIKLLLWLSFESKTGKKERNGAMSGGKVPSQAALSNYAEKGRNCRSLRFLRQAVVYYVSASDVVLLLFLVENYLTRKEGRELLQFQQNTHHDELERRVVAFNSLALVLTNLAAFGMFTYEALTYGVQILNRATWTASIAHSRQASLIFTCLAYCLSMRRHGYLPSFFTLLVVFNGQSLSKVSLWACIEVQRTLVPLWEIIRRRPVKFALGLAAYGLVTRTPSDALLLALFVSSAFWAWRIQIRLHYVDIWAFGLTTLAVLMTFHQAWQGALLDPDTSGPTPQHDAGIFEIQLSDTHLNITSRLGLESIALRSPPLLNPIHSSSTAYPFCSMDFHGLSLLDYTSLSFLAYLKRDSPAFRGFLSAAFDPTEWRIMHTPSPRAQGAVFIDMYNSRLNTSVIAIRGTNPTNFFDVFQDMIMFNGSLCLEGQGHVVRLAFCWDVVGMLVPLVRWLPSMWTANLLYISYLPLRIKFESLHAYRGLSLHYHQEIQNYVEEIRDRKVVLTGHSLGGGIGKVVAARLYLPIVAISSPGIALSHKIFQVPLQSLDKFEVNLIAAEDIVPKIDRLTGVVLKMHCHKPNPLNCHELSHTLVELHDKCGLHLYTEKIPSQH